MWMESIDKINNQLTEWTISYFMNGLCLTNEFQSLIMGNEWIMIGKYIFNNVNYGKWMNNEWKIYLQ